MYKISFPAWISYNIYKFGNEIRVYISNEYTHEFYLLTEITAELFAVISGMKSDKDLTSFIEKNNLQNEFDDFLEELSSLGIITLNNNINFIPPCDNRIENTKDDEASKFQEEMRNWISDSGFMPLLFIEVTYKCNLSCIHCFNDKNKTEEQITFNDIKQTIDDAKDLGVFNITISGGECTLCKDFIEIAKYIREKRIALSVFTNGQTLYDNQELFEQLIGLYPHSVSLSLYSMNPEIHDKITGVKGSHYKTLSVIKKLKDNNVKVIIKCFLLGLNFRDYKKVQEFGSENGIIVTLDSVFFNNPVRNNENVQCNDKKLLDIYSDKNGLLKSRKMVDSFDEKFFNTRICTAGYNGLSLDPSLNIYPCVALKILLGNLKENSLKDIWLHNKKSELKNIQQLKQNDLKDCYKEEFCKFCFYCPGLAMFNNKYLKKYDNFCRHAKARMEAFYNVIGR